MIKLQNFFIILIALPPAFSARTIQFLNRCSEDIWVNPLTNNNGSLLEPGIVQVAVGAQYAYTIPDNGWEGRFWPKMGCDPATGHNCHVGQSMPPCLPAGCDPPAETKVEFYFPAVDGSGETWYDVSLVDGYSVAAEIIPSQTVGSCTRTNCAVSLDACPMEREVNDLRVIKNGKTVQCLSPCKKWNFPPPFGLDRPETSGNGLWYCCPTPPVTPEECRNSIVVRTEYVQMIHRDCPTAYSYSYDDEAGLHNCPSDVNFQVNFC